MYTNKGMFKLFRSIRSGRLCCNVEFEFPDLISYFDPYPAIFKFATVAKDNDNSCLELIDILEKLKNGIDNWISYLKVKSEEEV